MRTAEALPVTVSCHDVVEPRQGVEAVALRVVDGCLVTKTAVDVARVVEVLLGEWVELDGQPMSWCLHCCRVSLVDGLQVMSGTRGACGWSAESFGLGGVGGVEDGLAVGADGVVVAVVDVGGGVVADAGVAVVVVVVVEERVGEGAGVGEAGEACRGTWAST